VEGEGCFLISIVVNASSRVGCIVSLRFSIGQHTRDLVLMEKLVECIGCGSIGKPKKSVVEIVVTRLADITDKIIPIFDKYPLQGVKALNFYDFTRAAELIKNKAHLNQEGLEKIKQIKAGMNKGRQIPTSL